MHAAQKQPPLDLHLVFVPGPDSYLAKKKISSIQLLQSKYSQDKNVAPCIGRRIYQGSILNRVTLREIPGRIYLRYLLLTIPGVVILFLVLMIVEHWVAMPAWLFWALIILWLAKEVIIFPFVWQAHDPNRPGLSRTMIGAHGIVKERLDPAGYIQVGGELWKAEPIETHPPIEKGERVRVLKMQGLKLFVTLECSESED